MFRFTIRDVLWLMVVVGMGLVVWIEERAVRTERVALERERVAMEKERAAVRASLEREWAFVEKAARSEQLRNYELRLEHTRFLAEQVPEAERERAKRRSLELGAPMAAPLPAAYGERADRAPAGGT